MTATNAKTQPFLTPENSNNDIVEITASSYTLSFADLGRVLVFNKATAQTLTVPLLGQGFNVRVLRIGVGEVTISAGTGATVQGAGTLARYALTSITKYSDTAYVGAPSGQTLTKIVPFVQDATSVTHTGTVPIPAGAWLHSVRVVSSVLWTPTGAATLKVGDTADDDGYFTGVNLKATDLLVGEVLDTHSSTLWGGKEGAYLDATTGRRGPVTSNFGEYYAAGSNITGIITVGTPANTAGRTFMIVTYSLGETIAAVVA